MTQDIPASAAQAAQPAEVVPDVYEEEQLVYGGGAVGGEDIPAKPMDLAPQDGVTGKEGVTTEETVAEKTSLPPGISQAPAYPSLGGQAGVTRGYSSSIVNREERIEYRDQDGNLLDPEQVKELVGKVSFRTKYETKTRLVDADGNLLSDAPEGFKMD